jgi:hypothetical protein
MNAKLDAGDTNTRKGYVRSTIDAVEVDDQAIRIIGSKDFLQAAIAGKQTENGEIGGPVLGRHTTSPSMMAEPALMCQAASATRLKRLVQSLPRRVNTLTASLAR